MTVEFCYLIFITADYYAINYFVIPQLLVNRKYVIFLFATASIIAISAWLRSLIAWQMNLHIFQSNSMISFGQLFLNSLVNISFWISLIILAKMMLDRRETQEKLALLEKERVKNELDYLKAQINPHALFNSLNTVYGHIDKSNKVARNILLQFSGLLRYQLYDCGAEKVSLEKEIEYIKNYVDFQRLRKNERLIVSMEIENIGPGLTIAPLLLVVLVENAFKFVSNFPDKENTICIRICTRDRVLQSFVFNSLDPPRAKMADKPAGIGMVNLKRRLELLYSGRHELDAKSDGNSYEARLSIELA